MCNCQPMLKGDELHVLYGTAMWYYWYIPMVPSSKPHKVFDQKVVYKCLCFMFMSECKVQISSMLVEANCIYLLKMIVYCKLYL